MIISFKELDHVIISFINMAHDQMRTVRCCFFSQFFSFLFFFQYFFERERERKKKNCLRCSFFFFKESRRESPFLEAFIEKLVSFSLSLLSVLVILTY